MGKVKQCADFHSIYSDTKHNQEKNFLTPSNCEDLASKKIYLHTQLLFTQSKT